MNKKNKKAEIKDQIQNNKTNQEQVKNNSPVIVAIGASAGGLSALERFFKNTAPDKGIAYVVIQHLDPSHNSMLPGILQRYTNMQVEQIKDKTKVEKDTVYVIPPGHDLKISNNKLYLDKQENPRGVRLPIDMFFRSLKAEKHELAIGIILSGTGSDGTLGLRDIKAENGMIMVQEPNTAEHKGMPQNAMETGLVDFVLPPEEMPEKLIEFINESLFKPPKEVNYQSEEIEKYTNEIFKILRKQTKHDFSDYKWSTVIRRIERRMAVNTIQNFENYIAYLEKNPSEVDSLFNEFLIGVTSFFRDVDGFKSLEKNVLPHIFKRNEDNVRVWVTGCSTGEEAYSIAILLKKHLALNKREIDVQIFASDIDDKSLDRARQGRYPLNIEADVPADYLKSYFHKKDTFYQVKKELREMVVFANQSIVKDPPYSRIDLISCRNLLIYLKSDIQKRILDVFHYALKEKGYLFLGNSESLGSRKELFEAADTKWKIFQKSANGNVNRGLWAYSGKKYTYQETDKEQKKETPKISVKDFAERQVLQKFMYPFFVIDKEGTVHYSIGKLSGYFEYPQGEPNNNILSAAVDSIKVSLANALRKIKTEKKELVYDNIRFDKNDETEMLKLSVIPIAKPASLSNLFMVLLEPSKTFPQSVTEHSKNGINEDDQDEYIQSMERELHDTRDYLQSVIEELETSNEELKSANEEAQSSNEELQSTNEELETSKEELQSLNEELETSNHELQRKVTEVSQVNNDIQNFITSTQIGVIFLDKEMKIQRFTPSMRKIIELLDSDIGRPLKNFVTNLNYDNLIEDIEEVLETLVPKKAEVGSEKGGHFWMRILPYRTMDDKINGTVLTFTDITDLKKAQDELLKSKERFRTLFEKMNSGISVVEIIYDKKGQAVDGKIIDANNAYTKQTGVAKEKVVGNNISDLFPNFNKELFKKFVNVAETKQSFETEEHIPQFDKYFRISAYSFEKNQYVALFDDITDNIKAQNALIESEEKFREFFNSMISGIALCKKEVKSGQKSPLLVVESVNPAFVKITGIKSEKIIKNDLFEITQESDIDLPPELYNKKKKSVEKEIYWKKEKKHLHLVSLNIDNNEFALIIHDITKEKDEHQARQHLASIVESSEDAIYSIATDGSIISWNKGAENFYGYSYDEIIGKNVSLLSDNDNGSNAHEDLIAKVKKGKVVKNIELNQRNKSGDKIPVSLTKSPIRNDKGKVVAISDVVKDMTTVKMREIELVKAKQKSEEAAKLTTSFLQNVSHEIRTPMNSIIGFTDLLKSKIKDKNTIKFTQAIDNSGQQLLRLIDDILDLSRIESGELSIIKSSFNVTEIMYQLREQFERLIENREKKELELKLELPDDEPLHIYTDKNRLSQILVNLLSNAIKYTDKGMVTIGFEKRKKTILFFVKDTGKGIQKDHLGKIFERFDRAEIENENVIRGTGLGLAISKGLTEMLGGNIWCDSEVNTGSNFYFTIPNEKGEKTKENKIEESVSGDEVPNLKGKNILLAEDDNFSYEMIKTMLEPTQANIKYAKDGEQAIKIVENNNLDLALLDIRLPKKTGFEILSVIKEKEKNTPAIAQTAFAMSDDRNKIMDAGFDEYIPKPVKMERLYHILHKIFNK